MSEGMRLALGLVAIAWLAPIAAFADDPPTSPDAASPDPAKPEAPAASPSPSPFDALEARIAKGLQKLWQAADPVTPTKKGHVRARQRQPVRADPQRQGDFPMMSVTIRSTLLLAFTLAACMPESQRCDPDQRYSYGLCYSTDAGARVDTGPTVDASYAHFADVCTGDPDCAAPTDDCAKYPSDPNGYCTRTGCLTDPTLCPSGWGCLDLSVYLPGLPALCTTP
jgi:hypothetical protein